MTSQFFDMTSSSIFFFDVLLLLSSLITGSRFMSMSTLVLELWQFPFIRNWPEIQISEIYLSRFCWISGDWGKLGIPNLARKFLIKYYWMMQNAAAYCFYRLWVIKGKPTGGGVGGVVGVKLLPPKVRVQQSMPYDIM